MVLAVLRLAMREVKVDEGGTAGVSVAKMTCQDGIRQVSK